MEKKDRKKLLVLVLLLFAVVGTVGYGVYSYYWTQGNYENETSSGSGDDATIYLNGKFDPEIENGSFLSDGQTIELTCPESGGKGTVTCTGKVTIVNEGTTKISVETLDGESSVSKDGYIDVTAKETSFTWTSETINAGSSETLYVSVDVDVDNGTTNGINSSEAEEVTDSVPGGSFTVKTSFKIKATQVNN